MGIIVNTINDLRKIEPEIGCGIGRVGLGFGGGDMIAAPKRPWQSYDMNNKELVECKSNSDGIAAGELRLDPVTIALLAASLLPTTSIKVGMTPLTN